MSVVMAAGISAGASLLGGLFNRNAQKKANKANSPAAQVKAWEDANINPIMGITQGQWIPQQAVSMGDSFANAGGALARGMELNHEEQLANTGIRKENEKLKEALADLSKPRERSNVDRIGLNVPTLRDESINEAYDYDSGYIPDYLSSSGGSSADRPLNAVEATALTMSPDRDVERAPVEDTSLMMAMDNAFTRSLGAPMNIIGQDGEPLGLSEMTSLLWQIAPQAAVQYGKRGVELMSDIRKGDSRDFFGDWFPQTPDTSDPYRSPRAGNTWSR